ncbi:hypothetical protein LR48_Vigan09g195500 [Vigna angularis]|uniref:Uncharacterized protein n=1 Tax=Phaseolus angularis TaxID=3914 RepID=A0A0L9VE10_PHAAN|nr:hypothetical protein LR48_Vigan09g195500 [Vigna angularis]
MFRVFELYCVFELCFDQRVMVLNNVIPSFVFKYFLLSDGDKGDELIQILVQNLMKQLRNTPLNGAPFTVGLNDRVEVLKKLLDLKSNYVRALGLYGIGRVVKKKALNPQNPCMDARYQAAKIRKSDSGRQVSASERTWRRATGRGTGRRKFGGRESHRSGSEGRAIGAFG